MRPTAAQSARTYFDADAVASSHEEPTIRVGNLVYRGRLLSIEEWLPWWERMQALEAAPVVADGAEAVAALRARVAFFREYLSAVFPPRDFRFWAPSPVKHLMRQPMTVVEKTVAFFFTLQARATFGAAAMETRTTPGIDSPRKTAPALVGA